MKWSHVLACGGLVLAMSSAAQATKLQAKVPIPESKYPKLNLASSDLSEAYELVETVLKSFSGDRDTLAQALSAIFAAHELVNKAYEYAKSHESQARGAKEQIVVKLLENPLVERDHPELYKAVNYLRTADEALQKADEYFRVTGGLTAERDRVREKIKEALDFIKKATEKKSGEPDKSKPKTRTLKGG
jgi:hypothetical protein